MAKDILKRLLRRSDKLEKLSREIEDASLEIEELRARVEFILCELEDTVGPIRHVLAEREKTSDEGWALLERVALTSIITCLNEGGR